MLKVPLEESFNQLRNVFFLLLNLLKYLLFGTGLLGIPFMLATIFIRSACINEGASGIRDENETSMTDDKRTQEDAIPDVEIMPIPAQGIDGEIPRGLGLLTLLTTLVQPRSRGQVKLASGDPLDPPVVDLNYFSDPRDWLVARKAVRLTLNMAETLMKQGYPSQPYMWPKSKSEEDIDEFIRSMVRSGLHIACTCRMAPESDFNPGVVDDELRVHGIRNLRVCDTSVFPRIVSVHTMAPVVAVAEKCADMIKHSSHTKAEVGHLDK
jgi:hypothetical protein